MQTIREFLDRAETAIAAGGNGLRLSPEDVPIAHRVVAWLREFAGPDRGAAWHVPSRETVMAAARQLERLSHRKITDMVRVFGCEGLLDADSACLGLGVGRQGRITAIVEFCLAHPGELTAEGVPVSRALVLFAADHAAE